MAISFRTISTTTASVSAGAYVDINMALGANLADILKIKITPSVVGAGNNSKAEVFKKDTFSPTDLVYATDNFLGALVDPIENLSAVYTERNEGIIFIYRDEDATDEFHLRVTNNGLVSRTFTVVVTFRALDDLSVNVMDYGAVGDASTDDTAALQAAINDLSANGGRGGVVLLPSKIFKVTSSLTVTSANICLKGTSRNASGIVATSNSVTPITATNTSYFRLVDLFVEGPGAGSSVPGVLLTNTNNSQFDRIDISDFHTGYKSVKGSNSSYTNTLRSCNIYSNPTYNIHADAASNGLTVDNCEFGGGSTIGLKLYDSDSLNIVGGNCEGCSQSAVDIDASTSATWGSVVIKGVHFEGNTSTNGDIRIGTTNAIRGVCIEGCYFHASASATTPIHLVKAEDVVIAGNVIASGYFTSSYPTYGTVANILEAANRWPAPTFSGLYGTGGMKIGGTRNTTAPASALEVEGDGGLTVTRDVNTTGSGVLVNFRQKNASDAWKDIARLYGRATDVTAGAEMGSLLLDILVSGSFVTVMDLNRVDFQFKRYGRFVTGTPSISGTGTLNANSSDMAGKITSTITGNLDVTLTFSRGSWTNAPAFAASNETTIANLVNCTSTTTTVRLRGTTVTGDVIAYVGMGY